MTAIEFLLQQPAAQAVGWALLQFVWQGALIGALSALALLTLRRSAADIRYVVGAIGLSLMLTMPVVTVIQTWRSLQTSTADSTEFVAPPVSAAVLLPDAVMNAVAATPARARTTVVDDIRDGLQANWIGVALIVWLVGVAILSLRLLTGWIWVQHMKSHGTQPAPDEWQGVVGRLSRQLHISGRPIRLLQSAIVRVPTVVGWLRPVILLPASTLAGMAPQQLEAILAHELAHIRRHDYLVNLLQTLVETLLFYHPAVWWLSNRIRVERENCCDDLAVSLCGDPYAYAKALADLEELRANSRELALRDWRFAAVSDSPAAWRAVARWTWSGVVGG